MLATEIGDGRQQGLEGARTHRGARVGGGRYATVMRWCGRMRPVHPEICGRYTNATGDLKNARPDPQSGLGESNSNRRNGTQMDQQQAQQLMAALQQIAHEIRQLRAAVQTVATRLR